MSTDELKHHGVLGQKWGERNGPPYPLIRRVKERVYGVDTVAKAERLSISTKLAKDIPDDKKLLKDVEELKRLNIEYNARARIPVHENPNTSNYTEKQTYIAYERMKDCGYKGQALEDSIRSYTKRMNYSDQLVDKILYEWFDKKKIFGEELRKKDEEIEQEIRSIEHSDDILHYGVKGMRWGVRNDYVANLYNQMILAQQNQTAIKPTIRVKAESTSNTLNTSSGSGGGKKKGSGGGKKKKGSGKKKKNPPGTNEKKTKDKDENKDAVVKTFGAYTGDAKSLSDAIRDMGYDSGGNTLSIIAAANGINNYEGTEDQNEKLLDLLKRGLLKTGGTIVQSDDLSVEITAIDVLKDTIEHHGILGQRWGKKNGPPYPLDAQSHSASEKKEGSKGWTKEAKSNAKKTGIVKSAVKKIKEKRAAKKQAKKEEQKRKDDIERAANERDYYTKHPSRVKYMTDAELKEKTERLKLENAYRSQLQATPEYKKYKAQKKFKEDLKKAAKEVISKAAQDYVKAKVKSALLGDDDDNKNNKSNNNNDNNNKTTFSKEFKEAYKKIKNKK